MERREPIHPYVALGGGKDGLVHSPEKFIERHNFLQALPEEQRCYLHIDGSKLYYARIWGGEFRERRIDEKPPQMPLIRLIFIQGLAGTHTNWFPQLEYFAHDERYDIVALDSRGVGLSDTPAGRWTTSAMANDVTELIRHLQWNQCHMFGFSLGGMIALEAALNRPDFFKSVTLISTHAGGVLGTVLPPWGISPFIKTFGAIGTADAIDRGMELLHTTSYLDEDVAEVTDDVAKVASEVLGSNDRITNRFATAYELILQARKYVESGSGPEIRLNGTIKQIGAAITHYVGWDRLFFLKVSGIQFMVVAGMQDNLVNYLNSIQLADSLNAKLILKEDAGHGVNLHYRQEVNLAMQEHIDLSEVRKPVEGRRPLSARAGFPPGLHPWKTAVMCLIPAWVIAQRIAPTRTRRFLVLTIILSLIVRLTHGPLYRRSDLLDLI